MKVERIICDNCDRDINTIEDRRIHCQITYPEKDESGWSRHSIKEIDFCGLVCLRVYFCSLESLKRMKEEQEKDEGRTE